MTRRSGPPDLIEPTLFFVLGFLSAGLLALIVMPAIWRRAVNLTRRRIEASTPLTANEILAEKDKVRAEFAMATRRLEIAMKQEKAKLAEQAVEIGRQREAARQAAAERDEKLAVLAEREAEIEQLRAELGEKEEQLGQANERFETARQALEAGAVELDRVNKLYEEASFTASGRQIELVARESEVEKLTDDLARIAREQRDLGQRAESASAERSSTADALARERKRIATLETEIERKDSELNRLKEKFDNATRGAAGMKDQLAAASAERLALEKRIAELTRETATGPEARVVNGDDAAGANGERQRLETRLTAMTRENKKLRSELAAAKAEQEQAKASQAPQADADEPRGSASLREKIKDLAAEIVGMTIRQEGPDSPAAKAVAQASGSQRSKRGDAGNVVSLADRIRAVAEADDGEKT
jgi:predicted  nucleic acid-binding Zn-ribbon protein